MEDNVPIGMKRKAGKMTAEEKRAADVNACNDNYGSNHFWKENIYI